MASIHASSLEDGYSLERPLVVKCTFDQKKKRITFSSATTCSYHILRERVEKCFSLSGMEYKIMWDDDDGEHCVIESDNDVEEAIKFFASDGPPPSSNSSLLSGYSSSSRRITVYITIHIDYDGPSLSETSSIASREEYAMHDLDTSVHLSNYSRTELDDDEVTVSSKNTGSAAAAKRPLHRKTLETIHAIQSNHTGSDFVSLSSTEPTETDVSLADSQSLSEPFVMLKMGDPFVDADPSGSLLHTERGVAWLRDQSTRTIKSKLGALPEPSDKSVAVRRSRIDDGELSLHRDRSGKFYYSYNSGTSSFDSGYDENPSSADGSVAPANYRPTSMNLAWVASLQQSSSTLVHSAPKAPSNGIHSDSNPFRNLVYADIPAEVLPFIMPAALPQPGELTTCSKCDAVLDSIRYVCSTCKEKKSRSYDEIQAFKIGGKGKAPYTGDFLYPSHTQRGKHSNGFRSEKPIPLLSDGSPDPGYELCPNCLESAGVDHALEMSLAPGSSPSPTSPANTLSLWRRTAPQNKGQLRHAYLEKVWVGQGWQDVQQDELNDPQCSTCNSNITGKRYKCASCNRFNLCRACYSQVHDIHPSHAFLVVLDQPAHWRSYLPPLPLTSNDLPSMHHPGVKCAHCLLDIVGARFHCAVCESVDICQNCESAGLPGNLDSPEGGHDSSHIMIKIPYPLESSKVQAASDQAMMRWNGGDADNVQHAGFQLRSRRSSWDGTVRLANNGPEVDLDHKIQCSSCSKPIIGARYQCGNCPSLPRAYNLCSTCEGISYCVHNPSHVFFKFPRPVDRPVESISPKLGRLYRYQAGPPNAAYDPRNPREYLQYLEHASAYCDRCMEKIRGEWFHCVYCVKDLCDACEALDTHGDTHFFVVFKGQVDMEKFTEQFGDRSPPTLSHPVYLK